MRIQDFIIEGTQNAADEAFRYAAAVPQDKLAWKPLDGGRSVIEQAQELAKCPDWAYSIVSGAPMPDMNEASVAEYKAEIANWTTIDVCKAECQKRLEKLFQLYREMPDERLSETKWLPFSGGRDFSMIEMMSYPSWNFTYHAGQIAYIQTLYGDNNMY
jgi:hypothetical protein